MSRRRGLCGYRRPRPRGARLGAAADFRTEAEPGDDDRAEVDLGGFTVSEPTILPWVFITRTSPPPALRTICRARTTASFRVGSLTVPLRCPSSMMSHPPSAGLT
jgi:hypothetical protein